MAKYETMLITTATLDDEATAALVGKFGKVRNHADYHRHPRRRGYRRSGR